MKPMDAPFNIKDWAPPARLAREAGRPVERVEVSGRPWLRVFVNSPRLGRVAFGLAAGMALACGCTSGHYQKSADTEAGRLIREKSGMVPGMEPGFGIDPGKEVDLGTLSEALEPGEYLGDQGKAEQGARVLPLTRALEIAATVGNETLFRKEALYMEALSLSLSRNRYRPLFAGNLSASYQTRSISADKVTVGVDAVTGQPRVFVEKDSALVEQSLVQPRGSVNGSVLLASGARLTAAFTTDFLRFLTGDPMPEATASAFGQIVQPLWRGAGYKATMENLIQAERSLLYAMREFVAWRKDMAVQVASDYYAVLQARDTVRNNWADLKRSRQNVARERAFAEAGQRPLASLDQLTQQELNSETRWVDSVRAYREQLDRFKITIGLGQGTRVILDDRALDGLKIADPGLSVEESVKIALAVRLDLQNTRDRADDAVRQIDLTKNRLRPGVDLVARASMDRRRNGHFVLPDPNRYTWSAGLDVDLPLQRINERNNYRSSMILADRAKRAMVLAEEQLRVQVASDLRALDQARLNFSNAELGVKLAERRVEEQELRMELGRGVTRDLLDAQADLNQARNGRTAALVTHTTARLRYFRDLGILYVDRSGQWEPLPEPRPPTPK